MYYLHFTCCVWAIFGSTRVGCHGIPVPPEDPPLGTLHRNIYIEQPEGQPENTRISTVGQGSAAEETQLPETKPEVLQTKITQLEGEIKLRSKQEQEHRLARKEQEALFVHWKQGALGSSPNRSRLERLYPDSRKKKLQNY